jgi:hypothetical protein
MTPAKCKPVMPGRQKGYAIRGEAKLENFLSGC